MKSKHNPLRKDIDALVHKLARQRFLLNFIDTQIETQKKSLKPLIEGGRIQIISSINFNVTNLSASTGESITPEGLYCTERELIQNLNEMVTTLANQSTAQAYELFEGFLYDIMASYFQEIRKPENLPRKVNASLERHGKQEFYTRKSWREAVRYAYKTNQELLGHIRKLSPDLANFETGNWRKIRMPDWFSVFSIVRHSITHYSSVIPSATVVKLSKEGRQWLGFHFPCVPNDDGDFVVRMTAQKVQMVSSIAIDYAALLFKCLSDLLQRSDGALFPGEE